MDIKSEIRDFIKNDILEDLSVKISVNDNLLSEGLLDSLGLMRTIRFIEKTYKISVPFEDINVDNFNCINSINDYINRVIT